uniref:Metallo-beta-lactamase domain-containing protein n=1 Tax=Amphimedon queenslandica TaxID=400682 RepID=A0A1X7UY03_AMPQE
MNAILFLFLLFKVACAKLEIPDADDKLHIYALPVGQGDSTVIQCPKANLQDTKGLVTIIDAGGSSSGINAEGITEFLDGTKLNFAVITHSHADHLKYMNAILESYKQKVAVYHPCSWSYYSKSISKDYADPKEVPKCDSIAGCNLELNLCPSSNVAVKLSFVASAYGGCNNEAGNGDSLISKITYDAVSILITGDFELEEGPMKNFLGTAGPDLSSHIYRLSHHGSLKANPQLFLEAVGASYVFSSSGFRYGHPRYEVFEYYYKNKLPDNVAKHPYTFFTHKGNQDYTSYTWNIEKAIYVTSICDADDDTKLYYLVKFNIDKGFKIGVEFKHLGNDKTKCNFK